MSQDATSKQKRTSSSICQSGERLPSWESLQQTQVFLGLNVFRSSSIDFKQFSAVYLNHIKRILAYAIRSLAHVEVLKNATLLSLTLQVLMKECVLNWGPPLALLYALAKYSNLMTNMITTGLTEYIAAVIGDTAENTIINYKTILKVEVHFRVITRRSAIFVRS
jgi:hypothetical protein